MNIPEVNFLTGEKSEHAFFSPRIDTVIEIKIWIYKQVWLVTWVIFTSQK